MNIDLSNGQKVVRRYLNISADMALNLIKFRDFQHGIIKVDNTTLNDHNITLQGYVQKDLEHPLPIPAGARCELRFSIFEKQAYWSYSFLKQVSGLVYDISAWATSTAGWSNLAAPNGSPSIVNNRLRYTLNGDNYLIYGIRTDTDLPMQGIWRLSARIYNTTAISCEAYMYGLEPGHGTYSGVRTLIAPGADALVSVDVEVRNSTQIMTQPRLEDPNGNPGVTNLLSGSFMEADSFSLELVGY
jgi:hypothetical protein